MSKPPPRPFSDTDEESARRLYRERGTPPTGVASTPMLQSEKVSAWRYRPAGSAFDVYVSEFTVPVQVESYVAMTSNAEGRKSWDTGTKAIESLATAPPAELCHLHGQAGDAMILFWAVNCPFPIKDREYVLSRALRKLPADADGQASLYCVADRAFDESSTFLLKPKGSSRVNRVCTYYQFNVAWAESPTSTRVRSEYSEDPMMPLPSWLLTWVTTKALPAGIEGLKKAAAKVDERLAAGHLQAQAAAAEASSERRTHQRVSSKDLGHRRTASKERLLLGVRPSFGRRASKDKLDAATLEALGGAEAAVPPPEGGGGSERRTSKERKASKELRIGLGALAPRPRKTSKELRIGLGRGAPRGSKERLALDLSAGDMLGGADGSEETPSETASNVTSTDGAASAPPTPNLDSTPGAAPPPPARQTAAPPPKAKAPRPKIREVLARRARRGSARSIDAQLEVLCVVNAESRDK